MLAREEELIEVHKTIASRDFCEGRASALADILLMLRNEESEVSSDGE